MKAPSSKAIIIALSSVAVLATVWAGLYFYWIKEYRDRIMPGVHVGDINLGGANIEQATNLLNARTNKIISAGIVFRAENEEKIMPLDEVSFDSASSFPVLTFDVERMTQRALGPDKGRNFIKFVTGLLSPSAQKYISAEYNLDRDRVDKWLGDNFPDLQSAAENAYFSWDDGGGGALVKNPEKEGKNIDKEDAYKNLKLALDNLQNPNISLSSEITAPQIRVADLEGQEALVRETVSRSRLTLIIPKETDPLSGVKSRWPIAKDRLITWIKADNNNLLLDEDKISAYLTEKIAPEIDQEIILPRFEVQNGKVTSWQAGKSGYKLDAEASAAAIAAAFSEDKNEVQLITDEIPAENLTAENDFQIKEIIGTGHSRFSGSPSNRRHNIKTGAAALHGLLIRPGEEFSLLRALGNIDASTGYLTELVIKGNKTVPEYGGGLCQIGTTVFRATLSSGLPVTERRNHSYRVSYYEPAGTDATIYDPAPDFKFVNDTGNYILIQARISGDDLYFDFWGVKDGRVASTTEPVIYNIVKPAPTKIIETEDLAPGVKKCTESAHSGADAYFDYTVTYPSGSTTTPTQTRRFSSHYIPWQAVCLVGKEPVSEPENNVPTSTPPANQSSPTSSPVVN